MKNATKKNNACSTCTKWAPAKKAVILISVIFMLIFLISACDSTAGLTADSFCTDGVSAESLSNECIRIHIRANSNSNEDQLVKLKVRDEITAYLQSRLEDCRDKQDAARILEQEQANLINIANNVLYNNNFDYKSSIVLKTEHFPDRTYDGYFFPEGDYDALIINLGSGNGDNWWCVAFPPLCFIPDNSTGEKIVYKSWIKELLDKLFK